MRHDVFHAAFQNRMGETRVFTLWDQASDRVYEKEEIDRYLEQVRQGNLKASDVPEAFRAGNRTVALGVVFVAVLSALVIVLYRPILSVFASRVGAGDVAQFYSLGFTLFVLMAAWQLFDAADIVLLGALKGAGDTRFVMWMMLIVSFAVWIPLVWAVALFHNTMVALWGTIVVDVVILCAGSVIRWYGGFWNRIKMI